MSTVPIKLNYLFISQFSISRNSLVLLDVKEEGNIKLMASYVVSNASWRPLYDVRAFNKDSSVQVTLMFTFIHDSMYFLKKNSQCLTNSEQMVFLITFLSH